METKASKLGESHVVINFDLLEDKLELTTCPSVLVGLPVERSSYAWQWIARNMFKAIIILLLIKNVSFRNRSVTFKSWFV